LLAAAGLARLGETGVGTPLSLDDWLPAPAQGAIGVECRADDAEMRDLLAAIDHPPSRAEVLAERALLAALGGTCHSPVAVLCRIEGEAISMRAALFSADGSERVARSARFARDDAGGPARLAADLLAASPPAIAALFGGPAG